ncbi:interferon-inducible double-stranded RNA-dependent protein kinase activator A [Aphis craccivora]|uniref:Interferon-inducible double-stranded RNA-dependent protein kinase activator A n=1 Tax=Aphis craccivora TaxID=307492 RepID=A0A6G0Z597_APHCR|nr:interferon-inducible double-stranded RNA-dependent protein kinase activator A [Aphis craccivora]
MTKHDATNRFLDKLASISEIDDYLLNSTNLPCLLREHLFTVICSAGPYKSMSKDHAEKIAKKQAAQLSLEQINLNQQTYTSRSNIKHEIVDKGSNQLSSKKKCVQKLKKCNS